MKEFVELFFQENDFWNGYNMILKKNKLYIHHKKNEELLKEIDLENCKVVKIDNKKKEFKIILKNKKWFKVHTRQKEEWLKKFKEIKLHPFIKDLLNNNEFFKIYQIPKIHHRKKIHISHNKKMNIWSIIRENIGKILSRITMPITFNEPLTFLQRSVERLNYKNLLKKANNSKNQYERLSLIFICFIFIYADIFKRHRKPFNPLLGETFEFIDNDFKLISEQVSHHPPIHCGFGDCNDFSINYCFYPKTKLGFNQVSVKLIEHDKIYLKKTKEVFEVVSPDLKISSLLQGNLFPIAWGEYKVVNKTTGDVARFDFKNYNTKSKDDFKLDGVIKNKEDQILYDITGFYNEKIKIINHNNKEEILISEKIKENIKNYEKMYYLSELGLNLNKLNDDLIFSLPPTDSRFRPDLRAYENGDLKLAAKEKNRLEINQRKRKNNIFKPQWFFLKMMETKLNMSIKVIIGNLKKVENGLLIF